jgi:hypothetical protein
MTDPKRLLQPILVTVLLLFSASGIAQGVIQGPVTSPVSPAVPPAPPGGWANACYVPTVGACPLAPGVLLPLGIVCHCANTPEGSGTTQIVQFTN